jgi:hypothetical protein
MKNKIWYYEKIIKKPTEIIKLRVDAEKGLNIRETASLSGKRIGLIPHREFVKFIDLDKSKVTIEVEKYYPTKITSNFIKIKYKEKIGWAFGYYLDFLYLKSKKDNPNKKKYYELWGLVNQH